MISVAIATYNSSKFILKQLDSIINQTISVDEIIIQDDCSNDKTISIIDNYLKSKKVNYIIKKNKKNEGYIKTFKKAIKNCNGDIIILCDHDDIWLKNKVEIIKNTFTNHPNILALGTSFIKINENDEIIDENKANKSLNNGLIKRKIKKNQLNHMFFSDISLYNMTPGCTAAFNSKIKKELLKYNYDIPHDLQIYILAAIKNELYYYDVITTKYRIYSNNTIGLNHIINYNDRLKSIEKAYIEKKNIATFLQELKCDNNYIKEMNIIIDIFEQRIKLLKTKNIIKYFILLIKSLKFNYLYKSIIIDIYSIIKK